jgi:hypothetical protein
VPQQGDGEDRDGHGGELGEEDPAPAVLPGQGGGDHTRLPVGPDERRPDDEAQEDQERGRVGGDVLDVGGPEVGVDRRDRLLAAALALGGRGDGLGNGRRDEAVVAGLGLLGGDAAFDLGVAVDARLLGDRPVKERDRRDHADREDADDDLHDPPRSQAADLHADQPGHPAPCGVSPVSVRKASSRLAPPGRSSRG